MSLYTLMSIARRYGKVVSATPRDKDGNIIVAVEGGILVCYEHTASRVTIDFTCDDGEINIAV